MTEFWLCARGFRLPVLHRDNCHHRRRAAKRAGADWAPLTPAEVQAMPAGTWQPCALCLPDPPPARLAYRRKLAAG